MKKGIVSVVLAVGILAVLAAAQDMKKRDAPPKPAVGPSQALLDNWNDVGRKLIAMAEDFPEDKYDFKPVPAQRSFAEQLLHAANANYFFTNPVMGLKPPAGEDPKRDQYKTKAAVVTFVKPFWSRNTGGACGRPRCIRVPIRDGEIGNPGSSVPER